MFRKPDINLETAELELLQHINFDPVSHDERRANVEAMEQLARSLLSRHAIPQVRLDYFTKPECNPGGRGKSRQEIFEGNGTTGEEILCHPSFLKFLEYFIFGPNLPQVTIVEFKEAAQYGQFLSHSDMSDLLPSAKKLVRNSGMEPHQAAEEFHRLALECGAIPSTAESLRNSIRAIRVSR